MVAAEAPKQGKSASILINTAMAERFSSIKNLNSSCRLNDLGAFLLLLSVKQASILGTFRFQFNRNLACDQETSAPGKTAAGAPPESWIRSAL